MDSDNPLAGGHLDDDMYQQLRRRRATTTSHGPVEERRHVQLAARDVLVLTQMRDELAYLTVGLPRTLGDYFRSPGQSCPKVLQWLNARWQLRHCDAVGSWTRATGHMLVRNHGQIFIGERALFHSHFVRSILVTSPGGKLMIGNRTFLNYGADIGATQLVEIGNDCHIGTYVVILDNSFHDVVDRARVPKSQPVTIHDRVWIGNRVIVLPGVTIGEGAVIGAGSVVVKDVPSRTVAVGNPARLVREI